VSEKKRVVAPTAEDMSQLAADDIATPEDVAAHEEAMEAWRGGKTVPLASVI